MPKMPLPPAESIVLDSLAEVARGGMGSVELARAMDGRLAGQVLAVKRLHANIAEDPDFVSMFLDETWMTAALKHPNVAQVVAWGNDPKGMFLAIELVQGVSLSRLLKEAQQNQEPFAERTVAFICSQICGALVAAHSLTTPDGTPLQLVHRDLTPANVLVSFDGHVKVIDFGIAKAEERISHTRTGQLKGKPAYMAPEQQRGDAVDARADIFAFGVVMFELLAGRRPWTSKGAFDVMMEISNDPHPNLGELRRGLNPEFVAIAHKCLEKKADARFQSAGEIKARLDAWLTAKGFNTDDHQSLAGFVLRNCQPQVLWWQEALRGEHAVKKAPTFKELEEKIDEERENAAKAARNAAKPPAPPPAAGNRLKSTVPMQAYTGPGSSGRMATPMPSSQSPVSSQPVPSPSPLSQRISSQPFGQGYAAPSQGASPPGAPHNGQQASSQSSSSLAAVGHRPPTPLPSSQGVPPSVASVKGYGSTAPMNAAPAMPSGPASVGGPATNRRLITGAGTEFLALSPFATGEAPPQAAALGGTHIMDPSAMEAARASMGLSPGSETPRPPLAGPPAPPPPNQALPPSAPSPLVGMATLPSSQPQRTPPVRKRSKVPLVIAICVAIAGGVVGGAWLALESGAAHDGGQGKTPPKKK